MAVFVDINHFVKKEGEWSRPIFGNGGNKLIANEEKYENGQQVYIPYLGDDAYKKAYTKGTIYVFTLKRIRKGVFYFFIDFSFSISSFGICAIPV